MNRLLVSLFAMAVVAVMSCGGQTPESAAPPPSDPPASGGPAQASEPPPPATPSPAAAAGTDTYACVSQSSCREFKAASNSNQWGMRESLCANLGGTWTHGPCSSDNVVATCTKPDGAGTLALYCYAGPGDSLTAAIASCQIACSDDGVFEKK